MKRTDFLVALESPLKNATLKKWPKGNIMQYWGENPSLYSAGKMDALYTFLGGHVGIDIATKHRDPVYAAHDGTITNILGDRVNQGGLEVWLTSPELDEEEPSNSRIQTVYCHLDEYIVKIGDVLKQGQLLGYEGNTGFIVSGTTQYWGNAPAGVGTHLHFGLYEDIKKNGMWQRRYKNVLRDSVDPLPYITETNSNPTGDLSGLTVVLNNILSYINYRRG